MTCVTCGGAMRPTTEDDCKQTPEDKEAFPWCCDKCGVLRAN